MFWLLTGLGLLSFIFRYFSFLVLFSDEKYQKSFKRIFSPCLGDANQRTACIGSFPRARVSRASHACQVRAALGKAKVGSLATLRNFILPRVRTYHTKKPSRFVHALSARPHKSAGIDRFAKQTRSASPRQGKRAWGNICDDVAEFAFFIFLLVILEFCAAGGRCRS